ncbi:hypothetical protein [Deinococcus sedimenti]|nr:hypothetical protein [Deinococcus sedimenti]
MARYCEPTPTPAPAPKAEDRHAAANAEQVRILRAHLAGGKPC